MENVNKQLLDALKGMVSYVFGDLESGKSDVCDELRQLIAAAEQAQQAEPVCATCNGAGFTGDALTLCENCPECQQAEPVAYGKTPGCKQCDEAEACGLTFCPQCDAQFQADPAARDEPVELDDDDIISIADANGFDISTPDGVIELCKAVASHTAQPPAVAVTVPDGSVPVPLGFLQAFHALSHNYSLQAQAPDHYAGTERDAFSDAYARCGRELAKLRAMFAAEGCGACGDGCKGQGCRLERESPLTCQTCNGQVMVGGLLPNGGGYDGQPCPDCATPQATAEDSSVVQADALKLLQYMVDRMRDDGRGFLVVNGMDGKEVVSEWLPAARAVLATAQKGE